MIIRRLLRSIAIFALQTTLFTCTSQLRCVAQGGQPGTAANAAESYTLRSRVNLESWDDGGAISHFAYLHAPEIFPVAVLKRSGTVLALPEKLRPEIGDFVVGKAGTADITLRQFIQNSPYDGFIILHGGVIVYEQYPRMKADERHMAFSVSKVFVGTLIGVLEDRKVIDLKKSVDFYLPELAGTAWAGTSVRDVADMTSGMEGVEDSADAYTNPQNKHFLLEASMGWQPKSKDMPDSVLKSDPYRWLAGFKRLHPPGQSQQYASVNTMVLQAIIERVTGNRLADVLTEEIWSKMGAEGDGLIVLNERGVAFGSAGMVLSLRDLARFGLLYTGNTSQRVVPESFLHRVMEEGRPALLSAPPPPFKTPTWVHHASYQWDAVGSEGQLIKGGFADQMLYVDCKKDVVIAYFGTNAKVDSMPTLLPLHGLIEHYF
jgi:CubicO group peptidase (beta-lactamase class C family)